MDLPSFKANLSKSDPPPGISVYLKALWYDAKGNWDKSHTLVQELEADENAAWIHAYLHRKEGDMANADYWYRRAGKKRSDQLLEEEWAEIVSALL